MSSEVEVLDPLLTEDGTLLERLLFLTENLYPRQSHRSLSRSIVSLPSAPKPQKSLGRQTPIARLQNFTPTMVTEKSIARLSYFMLQRGAV